MLVRACVFILAVGAVGAAQPAPTVPAPYLSFPANPASLGAIPDGPTSTPGTFGIPRDVTFPVTGLIRKVRSVKVTLTLSGPPHTVVGDLDVVLTSPGGVRSLVVFSRTGATTATGVGDTSDATGPYTFADSATGTGWWQAAAAAGPTTAIAPGMYRTTAAGGAGQVDPAPPTSLDATFRGLMPTQSNGTWTLTFRDGLTGATGAVSAATLEIGQGAGPFDFDSDGLSDVTVVRASSGALTWYARRSLDGGLHAVPWGLSTDFHVPGDYDGDGRADFGVARVESGGLVFYVLQSTAGFSAIPFGLATDGIVRGDYDGDGKDDVVVVRNESGLRVWYIRRSSDAGLSAFVWGFCCSDALIAGADFDGDGAADVAIARSEMIGKVWYIRRSSDGGLTVIPWGIGSDFTLPNVWVH
jgi:subtilisin-like proprotein convertase family protein